MKVLGIVCARKGSERLPGKNNLEINGFSLAYNVTCQALSASELDLVVVSTDDEAILDKLRPSSAMRDRDLLLRERPTELATSRAPIEGVLLDALDYADKTMICKFDAVVFLPANSATVTPKLIDACVSRLRRNDQATAVMTVREVSEPPEWMWTEGLGAQLFPAYPTDRKQAYRMQDVPRRYIATGTVNVVLSKVLRENRKGGAYQWMGNWILGVNDPDAIEIHTERDYLIAKALLEKKT